MSAFHTTIGKNSVRYLQVRTQWKFKHFNQKCLDFVFFFLIFTFCVSPLNNKVCDKFFSMLLILKCNNRSLFSFGLRNSMILCVCARFFLVLSATTLKLFRKFTNYKWIFVTCGRISLHQPSLFISFKTHPDAGFCCKLLIIVLFPFFFYDVFSHLYLRLLDISTITVNYDGKSSFYVSNQLIDSVVVVDVYYYDQCNYFKYF